MKSKIIYEGGLSPLSISKIKIPVRRAIIAAIFDNFRSELTNEELLSLLPYGCSLESLISVCDKLHLTYCKIFYYHDEFHNNIRVLFKRIYIFATKVKF